ncbi:MAG: NAD-dependent epimerase/dehydratase family protein [Candidatus Omnitrophica bacterium]|nr:NAD-dependent epimerase/dehydratase family protein [Candidatus Omnitrophota bacterium]
MKKKVFVTGAGGFIGSHLCELLAEKGYSVRALIKYNSRNDWGWLEGKKNRNIEIFTGDIRSRDIVRRALSGVKIVFHLAALIGIPYSYHSPDSYVETNVIGTLNLLQAARDSDIEKFIHTSTSEVYGTAKFVPITEKHDINPQSPYAATKASADFIALSFFRSFGLPVTVIRPFNTYGPRQSARAIIPTIISQIHSNERKLRLGSLTPTRDFTFVKDTISAFVRASESRKANGEVFNIGSNTDISIGCLAKLIAKLSGKVIDVECDKSRIRPAKSEVERLLADTKKASEILSWKPVYSLQKGLLETISWIKKNRKSYKSGIYNV